MGIYSDQTTLSIAANAAGILNAIHRNQTEAGGLLVAAGTVWPPQKVFPGTVAQIMPEQAGQYLQTLVDSAAATHVVIIDSSAASRLPNIRHPRIGYWSDRELQGQRFLTVDALSDWSLSQCGS